jgi:hypothetical protein
MKSIILIASASVLALGLAACGQKPVARATLDCPTSQGSLTLKTKAADGKTCFYTSGDSEMTLQLVATPGGAEATLDRLEETLLAGRKVPATTADGKAAPEAAAAEANADAATTKVDGDKVDIQITDEDGVHVNDADGTAKIHLPGIHIEADDKNDTARVQVGPIKINANDDEATIRIRNDHRMKGEALSTEKRGIRATFISKVDKAPDGYRYVGYEAAGPKTGPITIGVLKAKSGDGENLHEDVQNLVRRNGGV